MDPEPRAFARWRARSNSALYLQRLGTGCGCAVAVGGWYAFHRDHPSRRQAEAGWVRSIVVCPTFPARTRSIANRFEVAFRTILKGPRMNTALKGPSAYRDAPDRASFFRSSTKSERCLSPDFKRRDDTRDVGHIRVEPARTHQPRHGTRRGIFDGALERRNGVRCGADDLRMGPGPRFVEIGQILRHGAGEFEHR